MVIAFIENNIEFVVFIFLLSVFLYYKRKNLQVSGSFPFVYMLMYRTKLGLGKMDRWSKNHPKVFLYFAYLSIFIGVVGMIAMFVFMFWQLGFIVQNHISEGGGLVLPLKTQGGLSGAVPVYYVPFWYWIIALFILVIVHEFAHGVVAERFNVKIKSSGFAFLGIFAPILPAAFVEPDERSLAKKKRWQQIAVFGAGSTSNFIFGTLFLILLLFVAAPFVNNTMKIGDISFSSVMNQSTLKQYNVTTGSIIALDGIYDKNKILKKFENLLVNQTLNLTINSSSVISTYKIKTFENPNHLKSGMIGISGLNFGFINKENYKFLGDFPLKFQKLLFYITFLNIGIGMMNLLPIWITDGGQIAKALFEKYFKKKRALNLYNLVSIISLILIIFTIWPRLLFNVFGLF